MTIHLAGTTDSLVFREFAHLAGFLFTVVGLPADRDVAFTSDLNMFSGFIDRTIQEISECSYVRVFRIDQTAFLVFNALSISRASPVTRTNWPVFGSRIIR